MTEIEAIEKIRRQICNEKGVQRYCRDNCMHGTEYCAYSMAIKALEEIQEYRAIGTVKEFKALKEKAKPMKVKGISLTHEGRVGNCPTCGKLVRHQEQTVYCSCEQRLDWK